jgi:sporulation protein YlmC with PRC-barrel domain
MRYISGSFAAMGTALLLPVYLYAQETSPSSAQPGATQSRAEGMQTQADSGQIMISAESLVNSKVLDRNNKEIGTLKSLMLDAKSGKLVRADITLGGGSLLGRGEEQRVLVPWEQLSVKRQERDFVLVMNQEFVETIKTEQTKRTAKNEKQKESASAKGAGATQQTQPPVSRGKQQQSPGTGSNQQLNASADDINKAKEALKEKGLNPGPLDGKMDSQTQQALREFQKQNNLTVTGSLDQPTAEKLGVKLSEQSTQQPNQPTKETAAPESKS